MLVSDRAQRILAAALAIWLVMAGLSDVASLDVLVTGWSPADAPRETRVVIGSILLVCAALLCIPRVSRHGASFLLILWVLRTVWDMTGGQAVPRGWYLFFAVLVVVWARGRPVKGA